LATLHTSAKPGPEIRIFQLKVSSMEYKFLTKIELLTPSAGFIVKSFVVHKDTFLINYLVKE